MSEEKDIVVPVVEAEDDEELIVLTHQSSPSLQGLEQISIHDVEDRPGKTLSFSAEEPEDRPSETMEFAKEMPKEEVLLLTKRPDKGEDDASPPARRSDSNPTLPLPKGTLGTTRDASKVQERRKSGSVKAPNVEGQGLSKAKRMLEEREREEREALFFSEQKPGFEGSSTGTQGSQERRSKSMPKPVSQPLPKPISQPVQEPVADDSDVLLHSLAALPPEKWTETQDYKQSIADVPLRRGKETLDPGINTSPSADLWLQTFAYDERHDEGGASPSTQAASLRTSSGDVDEVTEDRPGGYSSDLIVEAHRRNDPDEKTHPSMLGLDAAGVDEMIGLNTASFVGSGGPTVQPVHDLLDLDGLASEPEPLRTLASTSPVLEKDFERADTERVRMLPDDEKLDTPLSLREHSSLLGLQGQVGRTQVEETAPSHEVLREGMLQQLANYGARSCCFLLQDSLVVGLQAYGKQKDLQSRVESIIFPADAPSAFSEVLLSRSPYVGPLPSTAMDQIVAGCLGGPRPQEIAVFPVIQQHQVVAFYYVDDAGGRDFDVDPEELRPLLKQAEHLEYSWDAPELTKLLSQLT